MDTNMPQYQSEEHRFLETAKDALETGKTIVKCPRCGGKAEFYGNRNSFGIECTEQKCSFKDGVRGL